MDPDKIGKLIYTLRKEKKLTQRQLADRLHISDRTVSKWERGAGCPDLSMLPALSAIFSVDLETLLSGSLDANNLVVGNMKKLKFYVCPTCGNVLTGTSEASVSCCGKKLPALTPVKAEEADKLSAELMDGELFISSQHEMTKEHYISFVAALTADTLILKKQYPEWNLQLRMPRFRHGMLVWYCTNHGLFYQLVK